MAQTSRKAFILHFPLVLNWEEGETLDDEYVRGCMGGFLPIFPL